MTDKANPTVHASAVLVGDRAVLIRGPSGSGKSRLAFDLILAGRSGQIPPAILVGDDRVHLDTSGENLMVRPAAELAGLIEIFGLGIRKIDHTSEAIVGLVVDLADMGGLELDVEGCTAWAEAGLTTGEYTVIAAEHGLATPLATPAPSASAGSPWAAGSATSCASTG